MDTIFENCTHKELAEGYFRIAEELIEKVREFNPTAKIIENWEGIDRGLVIGLIESYHMNIGDAFWLRPFDYLRVERF